MRVSAALLCSASLALASAQDTPSPAPAPAPSPAAPPIACGLCEFAAVDGVLTRLPAADTDCGAECVELDASELGVTAFAPGVFQNLTIKTLKLDDNLLVDWFIEPVEGEPITICPAMCDIDGLEELSVSNNLVASLPADAFECPDGTVFNASALASLVLSSNELTELLPETLAPLTGLEVLSLNGNPIGPTMNALVFLQNAALDDLRLDNMNLSSVPAGLFGGNVLLTQIELDANSLTELPDELFEGRSLMEKLQLGGNGLAKLPSSISSLAGLKVLALEDNLLESVEDGFFADLTELNTLELQNQAPGFCVPASALPEGLDAADTGAPLCDSDGAPIEAEAATVDEDGPAVDGITQFAAYSG